MKRLAVLVALGAAVALALLLARGVYTARHGVDDRLLRVRDGAVVPFARVLGDLARVRMVFVGELHDQPSHHAAQLRVLRGLHEAGEPVAVGLEMFRAESQAELDRWVAGETSAEAFLPVYRGNWNLPWAYYRDIFAYAREHRIPLVGLNVSPALVRQVAREGFASLGPEQLGTLPVVRCDVDPDYEAFIRRALGMHGGAGRTFTNFCEAQLVWDTAMAVHLLAYLEAHPDRRVVVLAGSGHAWRRGIPEQVSRRSPVPLRVVVPEIPGRLERATVTLADADYVWLDLELQPPDAR